MVKLVRFMEMYESLKEEFPDLYMTIEENKCKCHWKISVFGYEKAIIGDAELMTVVAPTLEEALDKAIEKMTSIPQQMFNALELKQSGREIHVKREKTDNKKERKNQWN